MYAAFVSFNLLRTFIFQHTYKSVDVTFNSFNTLGPGAMMQNVQVLPFLRFLTFISTKNRLYNNIGNSRGDSFENPTKKGMTEKKVMDTMKKYLNKSFSVQILNSTDTLLRISDK